MIQARNKQLFVGIPTTARKGFSEENMIRAASAYFILNYAKAFQS
jgi:hypothetical protein